MLSSCLSGQTGPAAILAGYGTMGAVMAGFGELTGWPDRAPSATYGAYTDYVAPKFTAAALLAAVDHQRRTGQGQHIALSQAECSIHLLGPAILDYTVNGRIQLRMGNAHAEYAPSGVYPCVGNDRWIALAAPTEFGAPCATPPHRGKPHRAGPKTRDLLLRLHALSIARRWTRRSPPGPPLSNRLHWRS